MWRLAAVRAFFSRAPAQHSAEIHSEQELLKLWTQFAAARRVAVAANAASEATLSPRQAPVVSGRRQKWSNDARIQLVRLPYHIKNTPLPGLKVLKVLRKLETAPSPHLQLERARLQIGQKILGDDLGDLEGRAEVGRRRRHGITWRR